MNNNQINQPNQLNQADNERYVEVSKSSLYRSVIWIIIWGIWSGSYLNDWIQLKKSQATTYNSVLLFCFMLNIFFLLFENIKKFYIKKKILGRRMTIAQYNSEMNFNSTRFLTFCNMLTTFFELIEILMVPQFIPFTKANCYDYSHDMCSNGRIGAFTGIVLIITYGLMLFFFLIIALFILRYPEILRDIQFRNVVTQAQRIPVLNQLSVLQHLTLLDEECAICIQNGTESNDPNFVKLPCGHNFHEACVREWIQRGQNIGCPMCRAPIDLQNTRDLRSQSNVQTYSNTQNSYYHVVPSDTPSAPLAPPVQLHSLSNSSAYTVFKHGQPVSLEYVQPSAPPAPPALNQTYYVNPNNPKNNKDLKNGK